MKPYHLYFRTLLRRSWIRFPEHPAQQQRLSLSQHAAKVGRHVRQTPSGAARSPPVLSCPSSLSSSSKPAPTPISKITWRLLFTPVKFFVFLHLTLTYVITMGHCSGPSMLPTIPMHGVLVILQLHRRGRGIEVGDMVCFLNPVREDLAVKRVLGREGDFVVWDDPPLELEGFTAAAEQGQPGQQKVNGGEADSQTPPETGFARSNAEVDMQVREWIDMMRARYRTTSESDREDMRMVQVPKGHVWLGGDNLSASRDSRMYGPVPMALIRGKVIAQFSLERGFSWVRNSLTGSGGWNFLNHWNAVMRLS